MLKTDKNHWLIAGSLEPQGKKLVSFLMKFDNIYSLNSLWFFNNKH